MVGMVALYGESYQRFSEFGVQDDEAFEVRAVLRNFILPTVQIVAGSVFPSWVAFPYFVCSCAGLFHWSMTSNFFGLSWGWRPLLVYNGSHIMLFYFLQLPFDFPSQILELTDYLGLFNVSAVTMDWARGLQSCALLGLYILLCFAIGDMENFDYGRTNHTDGDLHESLLYSPRQARSRRWWISEQKRFLAFKKAAVWFFAYGFPTCLVALVCWSFKFQSFCAFFLLVYIGIILFIFPSLFLLRRLNAMLLGFILLWALCTYIFNAGFTIMISRFKVDIAKWQTIGLVRYSSPGLYLLAQFALSVLVATDLFVGNSILDNADVIRQDEKIAEEGERREKWMLFMAVIAWCLRRSTHVISLLLIFIVALKSGLIHAVYMVFFLVYLLSSSVARQTRQYLMLFSQLHFGLLYILQLDWTVTLTRSYSSILKPVLSQLGLWNKATYHDYIPVAALLCFCAVQNHGIKVISSLSAVARQRALRYRPFVLSVYGSQSFDFNMLPSPTENWITKHLVAVAESFRATYRSLGTYIVYATVLLTVYAAEPNFVAFGFLFLLLVWITGRQILGKSEWPLWTPLFLYTCLVFVSRYIISVFPELQQQAGRFADLVNDFGFDPKASLLFHLWDSLAILAVLQLYKFERSQPSVDENFGDISCFSSGSVLLDFIKRLLILHSGKILSVAVFYASITPVSGSGLVFLLLLVFTSFFRKASALPSQVYASYAGLLLALEYLFQIFGEGFEEYAQLLQWTGFRYYDKNAWGIESGTRSKTLVLLACMLQYCSFQWLEQVPVYLRRNEEPCLLFRGSFSGRGEGGLRDSLIGITREIERQTSNEGLPEGSSCRSPAKRSPSFSTKESKKWSRRALILKHEKYEAQWQALFIWGKYYVEHFFAIFGVEIIMLTLLVAAFAVLNIVSLIYIFVLAICILLSKRLLRPLWWIFTTLFAAILVVEYVVLAKLPPPWSWSSEPAKQHCHPCWFNSKTNMSFCWDCWLGVIDDRQLLVAYFLVFISTSFQLRSNKLLSFASFQWAKISATQRLAWAELSYDTATHWTWLDYFRFFFYRRLLHAVLLLVFITGTLQYDLLHLGYLGFSMVFFHIRTSVMMKRNTIFFFLRLYNFGLIVASLVFQAPAFGYSGGCTPSSIFGLYKYDYGFRITARSALVDITIFCLVGLQSRIFRTKEFEQVLRYMAAEQVEARAYAQERKAEWKKEQLQRIRQIEERKTQRRLQVDKMKMEQLRLDVLNSTVKLREAFQTELTSSSGEPVPRSPSRLINSFSDSALFERDAASPTCRRRRKLFEAESGLEPLGLATGSDRLLSSAEVTRKSSVKLGILSGVPLLEDGVVQMQNIGNKALANLVGLLNLENQDAEDTGSSSAEEDDQVKSDQARPSHASPAKGETPAVSENRQRLSMICSYVWAKVKANTDVVCYVLFLFVYVWNFSLLTLVYPACLFLYALLANPGPSQLFWSAMLFYTEVTILLQYMYQTIVNLCGHDELPLWLKKIGIPGRNMNRSFVASVLPLFLVYMATLAQNSIKAREGEWMFVTEFRRVFDAENPSAGTPRPPFWKFWMYWTIIRDALREGLKMVFRCWRSLTSGSEVPPHFVQVTFSVPKWPGDGIQPERIESAFNRLLRCVRHGDAACENKEASRVRVESLECGSDNASAVLEVIHAAAPLGSSVGSWFTSLTPASDVASELLKAKQEELLEQSGFPYSIISVIAGGKRQVDLYAYVFGTDLVAFLYAALFYQSIIKNSPEFLDVYQLEDQFPKEFVFVLMTLFFLIVLDRVLYLSAFAVGKVFYYLFTLVLYTSYVTKVVWGMELSGENSSGFFLQLLPLRGFFLLKALSLSLQALQLRFGVPNKSTLYEQFLMRRVNSLSWLGFRIYRSLPFLFELRCVLDWSCTTTALSMYDWLKLEDIYASLFLVQCDIKLAREKHQLGQKRSVWLKFCNGLCLFFILICVIWAPMLIYSSGNPTNFVNDITEAQVEIVIKTSGGSFTLYKSQLCKLQTMSNIMEQGYDIDPDNVLESFDIKDIQLVCCEEDADSLWLISPPTLRNLVRSFNDEVSLVPSWSFHRDRPKGKEFVTFTGEPLDQPFTINMLQGVLNGTRNSIAVAGLYPRYFRVTSAGEVRVLEQTTATVSGNLTLNRETQQWWSFHRENASMEDGCGGVHGPLVVAVSEEVPKGLIGDTLSKFNIWSLYITFVLAVGRFIRLQCADLRMRIPYENFPSCERLIAICEDIYTARAEGELVLEEGLFWTLIKIYRSPHILIEYTKKE